MADAIGRLTAALADRYVIERELGAGGMATVYLAHDVRHDRPVALKVLRPELSAILGAERFLAEIKTTANLQHPHILSLFDSGEADGLVFYVMPYVEGESLRDRITRERQLPVDDAVRIANEVKDFGARSVTRGARGRAVGARGLGRGIGGGCDEEAIRVVKKMPAWKPGKQNGQPVMVYFTLPVLFKLSE